MEVQWRWNLLTRKIIFMELFEGKITPSGNFKLVRKITSVDDFWIVLQEHKSLWWSHRVHPTSFFQSWTLRTIISSIQGGYFWTIEKIK